MILTPFSADDNKDGKKKKKGGKKKAEDTGEAEEAGFEVIDGQGRKLLSSSHSQELSQ